MSREHKKNAVKLLCLLFFLLYLGILIYLLIFSDGFDRGAERTYHYNLVPFREISRFWQYREQLGIWTVMQNIFGNVLGFVPFGLLLPAFSKKFRSTILVTFLSFDVSLGVEIIQLVLRVGSFDVDDVILNTLGGLIGYLIFALLYHIRSKKYAAE